MSFFASPASAGKVSGYCVPSRLPMPGSWGARKPMRVKLKLSPPEIKAEPHDETAVAGRNTPNDQSPVSSHHPVQQSTPTPAPGSLHDQPGQERCRFDIPSESDISALDIGPSLTRSHTQPAEPSRVVTSRAPLAARTGFMRSITVATHSSSLSEETRPPEDTKEERPKSDLCISDLDSEAVTSRSSSINPDMFPKRARRRDETRTLPDFSDIRHLEPGEPEELQHYYAENLESEIITFSGGMSITSEVLRHQRRDGLRLRLLEGRPNTWKRRVLSDSDLLGLGYGSGFDVDIALKDRHLHRAINHDPQTSGMSLSQPKSLEAVPPWSVDASYPGIYTAGTDDYNWSQEAYERLKDDSRELNEQDGRLDEGQPYGDDTVEDQLIEELMDEDKMHEEL